jgi:hypothetical protein
MLNGLRYQVVVASNGITIHTNNAKWGNVRDLTILMDQQYTWFQDGSRQLAFNGYPAYRLGAHIPPPFHSHIRMSSWQRVFNRNMTKQVLLLSGRWEKSITTSQSWISHQIKESLLLHYPITLYQQVSLAIFIHVPTVLKQENVSTLQPWFIRALSV